MDGSFGADFELECVMHGLVERSTQAATLGWLRVLLFLILPVIFFFLAYLFPGLFPLHVFGSVEREGKT